MREAKERALRNILNCEATDYLEIGFTGCKCSVRSSLSLNHITP